MALKFYGRIGCFYTIYHFIKVLKSIISGSIQEDLDNGDARKTSLEYHCSEFLL